MPPLLRDVWTGEPRPIDPERTLLGSSPHVDYLLPHGGPPVAALLVHYPSGWVLHPLTDQPPLTLNGVAVHIGHRESLVHGDVIEVAGATLRFEPDPDEPAAKRGLERLTSCHLTICGPDGMEECRVIDHDLLIGRQSICHLCYPDNRLSRVNALLAADGGTWYAHNLAKGPIGVNRFRVDHSSPLEDGDEMQIGPLVLRVGLRSEESINTPRPGELSWRPGADTASDELVATSDSAVSGEASSSSSVVETLEPTISALRNKAMKLDGWLKRQNNSSSREGRAWMDKVRRFWADTQEATSARSLRNRGRLVESFVVLDTAIRSRPDSPDLLWELYRLYKAAGLFDLCYRPLRQIEKLTESRGVKPDTRVFETLAHVCEELGAKDRAMFDRAISYWTKLEAATGVSYARERASTMAKLTILDNKLTAQRTSSQAD